MPFASGFKLEVTEGRMLDNHPIETDDMAVQRVLGGDTDAFSVLVKRHSRRVLGACIRITRDREAAEDCVQMSLVTAFQRLDQFRAEAPFSAWLTRIAVNVAFTHLRREKPARAAERPIEGCEEGRPAIQVRDPRLDPEAACYQSELGALLREEIDSLPPKFRTVVILREIEGLNTGETARALGISLEAVKSRLFRAHRRIQHRLEPLRPER
jgi:RNA polymerase sigma-70 factor (ECF subfamily)